MGARRDEKGKPQIHNVPPEKAVEGDLFIEDLRAFVRGVAEECVRAVLAPEYRTERTALQATMNRGIDKHHKDAIAGQHALQNELEAVLQTRLNQHEKQMQTLISQGQRRHQILTLLALLVVLTALGLITWLRI